MSKWDKTTKGICGIKPELWKDIITDSYPNSLQAGAKIIKHLLERYDGDFTKTLKHYKGAKRNFKSVNIALNHYDKLKKGPTWRAFGK